MPKKNELVITGQAVTYKTPDPTGGVKLETFVPYTLIKRGVKREIITPLDAPEQFQEEAFAAREKRKASKDSALVKALGVAHYWQSLLDNGKFHSLTEIANAEGIDLARVSRIMQLTQLSPDIIKACISDKAKGLTLEHLIRRKLPIDWYVQKTQLKCNA